MGNVDAPLFLGIDFGTTRVKAALAKEDETIVARYSISWTEAGCSKLFLSDWLKMMVKVIDLLFAQAAIDSRAIKSMAITTISPCIVLVDATSTDATSPILLYDEPLHLYSSVSRIERINASINLLSGFTPKQANSQLIALTASAWLVWQLTGAFAVDNYSLFDSLGDSGSEEVCGAQFPENVLGPSDIVSEIKQSWSVRLNIPKDVKVCCGGTDTVALVRAIKMEPGEHLIYLGTFFSVLQSVEDFSSKVPRNFASAPFRWHISLEGGALLERLAASFFPFEKDRNSQVHRYLEVVKQNLSEEQKRMIVRRSWSLGTPVQTIPLLSDVDMSDTYSMGRLSVIPFFSFAQALKDYFGPLKTSTPMNIVGGLSSVGWIADFLSSYAEITCSTESNVLGAEGSSLLARDSLC